MHTLNLSVMPFSMLHSVTQLLHLYLPIVAWAALGWFLERLLPKSAPIYLGQFLFWVGVPISILVFLRGTDLTGQIWIAPAVAWVAMLMSVGMAWLWLRQHPTWNKPTQGSFLLAAMIGNTGYLGYPVTLALVEPQVFTWALFYDLLGTTLGAYGLGVILASRFGADTPSRSHLILALLKNPALWSFGIGLAVRHVPLPTALETSLHSLAWGTIALSLILIGMRLSQLTSLHHLKPALLSLLIKMLIVPLVFVIALPLLHLSSQAQTVLVLQVGMPPAFATLVLAETYELDQTLTVTAIAVGSIGLFVTLPLWLWFLNG